MYEWDCDCVSLAEYNIMRVCVRVEYVSKCVNVSESVLLQVSVSV